MTHSAGLPPADRTDIGTRPLGVSAWNALIAPWLALYSPSRAAVIMVRSPRFAVIVSFALHSAILAGAIVGIALWSATLRETSLVATTQSGSIIVQFDTIEQVWHKWHRDGLVGPAEQIVFSVGLSVPALACICAWTYLPSVHKSGSAGRSFYRAFCSVAACIVILLFAALAVGTVIMLSKTVGWGERMPPLLAPVCIPLGICVVLWTVGRAVGGIPVDTPVQKTGPHCEQCGYNLTHVGQDNRCPECGTDVHKSLSPNQWRPGCVWEERGGLAGWLVTSIAVLLNPREFYSRLKLRTPNDSPRLFASWHYFWIATGAALGGFVLVMITSRGKPSNSSELFLVPCRAMFTVLCLAWGVRRLAAGLAASWLLQTRELTDFGWVRRIVEYEIAYLWAFCAFNGLILVALNASSGLANQWFLRPAFFWMPLGPALILFGNPALGLIWLYRYRIAARAIRWNNF